METFIAPALSAFAAILVPAGVAWLWRKIKGLSEEARVYADSKADLVAKKVEANRTEIATKVDGIIARLDKQNGALLDVQNSAHSLSERVARIEGRLGLPPHEELK